MVAIALRTDLAFKSATTVRSAIFMRTTQRGWPSEADKAKISSAASTSVAFILLAVSVLVGCFRCSTMVAIWLTSVVRKSILGFRRHGQSTRPYSPADNDGFALRPGPAGAAGSVAFVVLVPFAVRALGAGRPS